MGLSISDLKKALSKKTKGELVNEISMLYQKFPQVKEYYQAQWSDPKDILNKHKTIIQKEFIEGKTRGLPKARLSVAKKAISDFRKLTEDSELISDLMLTFVESVSWFSTEFGPDQETFYTSPENMFEKALKLIEKSGLLGKYQSRAKKIVMNATDGYGHQDSLHDKYEEAYGEVIEM
ncbi:MAG: hypothetical protein DRH24_13885 [Deltaproteobacteria bacterium]|nr:MAG: hypothetical protein DRH24_13885 [Deltaproteobacteria bacterium]